MWGGPELIAAYALAFVMPGLATHALRGAGFFDWYYGAEVVERAMKGGEAEQMRLALWGVCLALPLQLACVLGLMRSLCNARPEDMGLTTRGAGWSMLGGLGLSVGLLPAVYGLFWGLKWVSAWAGLPDEKHGFEKLAAGGLDGNEWALLVFAACVRAPLLEELMFRGLVQRWAERGREEGWFVMFCALAVALSTRLGAFSEAWVAKSESGMWVALMPALCVLALAGAYALLPWPREAGVFAAAVLFAFVHPAWPAPLPLLVLALGLGWLASRWDNLAGPMLVHLLNNGVACVALAWEMRS